MTDNIVSKLRDADEQAGGTCCDLRKEAADMIEELLAVGIQASERIVQLEAQLATQTETANRCRADAGRYRERAERAEADLAAARVALWKAHNFMESTTFPAALAGKDAP